MNNAAHVCLCSLFLYECDVVHFLSTPLQLYCPFSQCPTVQSLKKNVTYNLGVSSKLCQQGQFLGKLVQEIYLLQYWYLGK